MIHKYTLSRPYQEKAIKAAKQALEQIIRLEALKNRGETFSFSLKYDTKVTHYSKGLFGQWKRTAATVFLDDESWYSFDIIRKSLPKVALIEIQERHNSKPGKTDNYRIDSTSVVEYEVVLVTIPAEYSLDCYYNQYSKVAYPFRERLLTMRRDVLEQIVRDVPAQIMQSFYVTYNGIMDEPDSETRTFYKLFSNYGMAELNSLAQCYGFALAIVEVAGYSLEQYLVVDHVSSIGFLPKPAEIENLKLEQW